ncbi:hypothetical protein ACHAWO_009519 [Cyclotella atomus]|uniref:Uncharacterized protein n=1 Tax=Cyclotella atomus TaxID=382360 RepID=A0ABD3PEW2_9STRA
MAPRPNATLLDRTSEDRPTAARRSIDHTRQKRRELSDLLERFYFSDDGTVGLHEEDDDAAAVETNGSRISDVNVSSGSSADDVNGSNVETYVEKHTGQVDTQDMCPLHDTVKKRQGRCPLCAAASTRLRRPSSCSSGGEEGESASGLLLGVPKDLNDENSSNHSITGEEVLDPKWADTLRLIRGRLASRSSSCIDLSDLDQEDCLANNSNGAGGGAVGASRARPLSKSLNGGIQHVGNREVVVNASTSVNRSNEQQHKSTAQPASGSLSQLRQMIVMAQQSVGRFTPNDDFDSYPLDADGVAAAAVFCTEEKKGEGGFYDGREEVNHYSTDDSQEESEEESSLDGNMSLSSMGYNNHFAESKGLIFKSTTETATVEGGRGRLGNIAKQMMPVSSSVHRMNQQHQQQLSSNSKKKELPNNMTVQLLPIKMASSDASKSDSSITLSLSSSSSSSSIQEFKKGGAATTDVYSPTCVLEQVSPDSSSLDPTAVTAAIATQTGREESTDIPFGPPFDSTKACCHFNNIRSRIVTPTVEEVDSDTDDDDDEDANLVALDDSLAPPCFNYNKTQESTTVAAPPTVKQVDSDDDDDEATVAFEDSTTPCKKATASSRPSRQQSSFISALVQNARTSRSKSRSRARSRSKSRGRKSRSKSRGGMAVDSSCSEQDAGVCPEVELQCPSEELEPVIQAEENEVLPPSSNKLNHTLESNMRSCQEEMTNPELVIPSRNEVPPEQQPEYIRLCPKYESPPPPPGVRGPIFHPDYQLGDLAREQDMIVFPSSKSRKGRRRHSRRNNNDEEDDNSDEENHQRSAKVKAIVESAIGQLCHLDAAFVRRSDGSWTYAIMADRTHDAIRFVVNEKGSTKSYPQKLWGSSVRRIRVLTQREGDRFLFKEGSTTACNNGAASGRRRRSIGNGGRVGRGGRSKGKKGSSRLTSPSPTRRNTGVLNIPPTIMEHHRHGRH